MANGRKQWGVTEVIVRYVSGDDAWEISLDPAEVDILVFNWQHFRRINEVVGRPIPPENHLKPDGSRRQGQGPPDDVARRIGLKGPPRRIGPRQAGTTPEPMCVHSQTCEWWCMDETHDHPPG